MLKEEILKIIRRKQCIIVFFIFFFSALLDFLITCRNYYGMEISWVRSAYQCGILKNDVPLFTRQFFTTLFPILASIAASDLYYEEQKLGINDFLYTRTSKIKNIGIKIISIAIVVFLIIFIPMMINFGLTLTAFPLQGYYCTNSAYLTLQTPEKGRIFGYLETYYPYFNIFIYIIIRCILGVSMALISFSISLLNLFNRYIVLLSGMVLYFLYTFITKIPPSKILNTDIFGVNTYGNGWMIAVYLAISMVAVTVLVKAGSSRENIS